MDLSVNIKNLKGTQMAAKIAGTFTVSDKTFPFTAIAFGRIGGHNIGAKISKSTEKELKSLGLDVNEVIDELQKSLIQGNITLPEGLDKESFVDD
ncbi:MAG: hypothetical protein HZA84_08300 [Thaumarchaeota archaeon]|nr:hypothetical protein [Nitrososphaerota archaeon]